MDMKCKEKKKENYSLCDYHYKEWVTVIIPLEFYVINSLTKYNFILGRKLIVAITCTPFTHHQPSVLGVWEGVVLGELGKTKV